MNNEHIRSIGGGDWERGFDMLRTLAAAMEAARKKHPDFAVNRRAALAAVRTEFVELARAVDGETPERQAEEAMDVAVTALRFWNNEMVRN